MGQYSYIRQQIENYRETLKEIEERSGISPEDEGLHELKQIFTNRITSLEMILTDKENGTASEQVSSKRKYRNAA